MSKDRGLFIRTKGRFCGVCKPLAIVALVGVLLIILVSCQRVITCNVPYIVNGQNCCLDEDDNRICDSDEKRESPELDEGAAGANESYREGDDAAESSAQQNATATAPVSGGLANGSAAEGNVDYALIDRLQKTINRLNYNGGSWVQKSKNSPYLDLGHQKLASLENIKVPIADVDDFKGRFASPEWKSTDNYLNLSLYDHLFKPLAEKDFDSPQLYKKYRQGSLFIEQSVEEQSIDTPAGTVLEYQELNWRYDKYGFLKGEFQTNLLIYKIFCSPNVVVYLSPGRDELNLNLLTATVENAREMWNQNVARLRPGMLQKAQRVMQQCPINKGNTSGLRGHSYQISRTYVEHDPTYLYFYWNLSTKIEPEITRSAKNSALNSINSIEVTAENHEPYSIEGPIYIDIKVKPDDKPQEFLIRDKKVAGRFVERGLVVRRFIPQEPIEFDSRLEIEARLYTESGGNYIRPQVFVLNY